MNRFAIYHAMDSAYCFPVSENEMSIRLRTAKGDIKNAWIIYESKYVIQTERKKCEMERTFTGKDFDYFTVRLRLSDTRLAYVFYLYDGEDYYYFSEDGVTKTYDYATSFYNFFQYPYINKADLLPEVEWTKRSCVYQIFVDRFNMGDESKDISYINMKWGDKPTPQSFAGGDLKGITQKLDHIKSLGTDTVYLTPVFRSVSNHKYDISDYYLVDPQFGSNEDLKELVDNAHAKGMRIILDAVFNHCSEKLSQFQDVIKNGKDSRYHDWFIIRGDRPDKELMNYEMFAACEYMPKFNTSNPEVMDFLIGIGKHYVTEYGIDGWRLDVSDEVSHYFWRLFRKAIKDENPQCAIIGENWHDASSYLRGDQYDSIMNYAFTKACLDYFAHDKLDAQGMADRLNDILARNNDVVNSMMMNLLDSHDTNRIFSEVNKDKDRMYSALALLYMFPGMPCIFQGTETLTEGGYDPDCRRCMDWKGIEEGKYKESIDVIRELAKFRKEHVPSDAKVKIYAENDVLILKRYTDEEEIELYISDGKAPRFLAKSRQR